tara:strand:+ start:266 stop:478 length:213 start_codon:yes stop_codon:yes gene_type:complete
MDQVAHVLKIEGMTCGCCSGRVTRTLEAVPGVIQADISWQNHAGIVVTTSAVTIETILSIVESTGFVASA